MNKEVQQNLFDTLKEILHKVAKSRIFVLCVVMILLLLINMKPDEKAAGAKNAKISKVASQHPKLRKFRKVMMSRVVPVCMGVLILAGGIFYGIRSKSSSDKQVIVYKWRENIEP